MINEDDELLKNIDLQLKDLKFDQYQYYKMLELHQMVKDNEEYSE
jgi:hypothetical protein